MNKILSEIRTLPLKYFQFNTTRTFDYTDNGQDAADKIYEILTECKPIMISRFGSCELSCLCRILTREDKRSQLQKMWGYISGQYPLYFSGKQSFMQLQNNAGVINIDPQGLQDFKNEYILAIPQIDILGSWLYEEYSPYIKPLLKPNIIRMWLRWLDPFKLLERPWTRILKDKKVLVIHPFAKSIRSQYARHELLFDNKDILPDFDLQIIKAVQSIAGEQTEFSRWIDALNYMKNEIAAKDFDIALIGCGAYGMPLAAYVKSLGKQAIHIGGALQMLFGIKGGRWDVRKNDDKVYNEYWIRPSEEEIPKNASSVEGGCYW